MKIWKKLLQVDRVHLEFTGNAIAFIVYSYKLFVRIMIIFRITKENE